MQKTFSNECDKKLQRFLSLDSLTRSSVIVGCSIVNGCCVVVSDTLLPQCLSTQDDQNINAYQRTVRVTRQMKCRGNLQWTIVPPSYRGDCNKTPNHFTRSGNQDKPRRFGPKSFGRNIFTFYLVLQTNSFKFNKQCNGKTGEIMLSTSAVSDSFYLPVDV